MSAIRLAIYARVSTPGQTVEPQLLELHGHAKNRGWPVAHEFTDIISGAKVSREGLDRLMVLVRDRAVDAVMVVKIDRLARSLSHFARLCDELKSAGVALIILGQGIDTSRDNPCGEMQLGILAVIAQFERSLIRERTRAGLAVARAKGKVLGHTSTLMPALDERAAIVAAWRAAGGNNYRALGMRLGGVSGSTAWRVARKCAAA